MADESIFRRPKDLLLVTLFGAVLFFVISFVISSYAPSFGTFVKAGGLFFMMIIVALAIYLAFALISGTFVLSRENIIGLIIAVGFLVFLLLQIKSLLPQLYDQSIINANVGQLQSLIGRG